MAGGILLQNAATTGNGNVFDFRGRPGPYKCIVTGTGTISAGAVQFETALTSDYTGTWEPLAAPMTPVESEVHSFVVTGPLHAVRARVTTNVTGGGSLTAKIQPPTRQY